MPQSDAAMKQLLLSAPDPNALAVKFAELKAHKVKDLDKVVVLLAKLLTGACSLRRQWYATAERQHCVVHPMLATVPRLRA